MHISASVTRVDRAVGTVIVILGLIWLLATSMLRAFILQAFGPFLPVAKSTLERGFSFGPLEREIPLWLSCLIFLPCIAALISGVGVCLGKSWGFQLAIVTFGLLAFTGNLALASIAVAVYALLRLTNLLAPAEE